jgi:hypothetical protein
VRRGPALFLLICLLVASAYGAQRVVLEGFDRVTGFKPTHMTGVRPPAGPPPLAQRVVLILAEGLRPDDARLLPTVDWMAERGAQLAISVPEPGYGVPAAATLLTGAQPEVHGVLLRDGRLGADNMLSAAQRVGLAAGGAGGADLGHLLQGSALENWEVAATPDALAEASKALLGPNGPKFVVLHSHFLAAEIRRLETASRDSADYRNALAQFDFALVRLIEQIDWKTTAVVLAGTVPVGADGAYAPASAVPLVMAGPGIKAGFRGEANLIDVTSTLSALAGAPVPLANSGRPVLGALEVTDGRPTDLVMLKVLEARRAYTEGILGAMGAVTSTPEMPTDPTGADEYLVKLDQQIRDAQFSAWRTWGLALAPYAGGALLLILIYLFIVLRAPFGGPVIGGVFTYAAVFHVIFFLTGGSYSAALPGLEEPGQGVVLGLASPGAGAMVAATMVTGYLLSRKGFKKRAYVATAALHMTLTAALLMALPVAVILGRTGWDFTVSLPKTGLLIWFFATGLQVMVMGYLSPLWAGLAVSAAALSRKWWPLKEIGDPERNADKVVRLKALRRTR